jgi:hypothetical protein
VRLIADVVVGAFFAKEKDRDREAERASDRASGRVGTLEPEARRRAAFGPDVRRPCRARIPECAKAEPGGPSERDSLVATVVGVVDVAEEEGADD